MKINPNILLLGILCHYTLTAYSQRVATQTLYEHESWDYAAEALFDNHVSSLEVISDDTLMCAWFGGLKEGWPDMRLMIAHSYDGGLNWTTAQEFMSFGQDTAARDPQLIYQEGILHLIFTRQIGAGNSRTAEDHALFYSQSYDLGQHWTKPDSIVFQGVEDNIRLLGPFNPPIKLGDEFIFGIHWYEEGSSRTHAGILLADLNDQSFRIRGDISPGYRLLEPVPLAAGDTLFQYYRTDQGFIYYNYSIDNGNIWTSPEPTALFNPDGLAYVSQWNADTILVVWNDHFKKRDYLTVGLFTGKALEHLVGKTIIDVLPSLRGQVSYPSVVRLGKKVRISYTFRQEERSPQGAIRRFGDIKYTQLDHSDLANESYFPAEIEQIDIGQSLLSDVLSIEDKLFICGKDKLFGWTSGGLSLFQSLDLPNTAASYDFYTMAIDSTQHSLHLGGGGGWYVEYDLLENQTNYEGIFDTLGTFVISDIHIDQDLKLVINHNGDVLSFIKPDDTPMSLNNLDSSRLHAIQTDLEALQQYYILSDSAKVFRYEQGNSQTQLLFQNTDWQGFENMKQIGSQAWLVGEKGLVAKLERNQLEVLDLGSKSKYYNFIDVYSLGDTQLIFITDKNKLWLYDFHKEYATEISLPGTPHFLRAALSPFDDRFLLLFSVEGKVYKIDLDSLTTHFAEILVSGLFSQGLDDENFIRLYPNPSSDILHLEIDESLASADITYEIYSQEGVSAGSGSIKCCTTSSSIDITQLPSGLFYLVCSFEQQNQGLIVINFIKL